MPHVQLTIGQHDRITSYNVCYTKLLRMPCLAKKYECSRDEFKTDGNPEVDLSISTRELAQMIKNYNINFNQLEDEDFDQPLGESTGASVIFGTTGGVIEAAVRTAYEVHTKKECPSVDFKELRGMERNNFV